MAFRTLICKAECKKGCATGSEKSKSVVEVRRQRVEMLKTDIKTLFDRRVANIAAVDKAARDLMQREVDARKALIDKWVAIAKEDVEVVSGEHSVAWEAHWSSRSSAQHKENNNNEVDVDVSAASPPVAADAFYEPWMIDD